MPRAKRRCNFLGPPACRRFQPCPIKGHQRWVNPNSPPLPINWNKLKREARRRDIQLYGFVRCGRCNSTEQLEADHIVPRCLDGRDVLSNIQWLCHSCHKAKTREDRMKCLRAKRGPAG